MSATQYQDVEKWYNEKYAREGQKSRRPIAAYELFFNFVKSHPNEKLLDISCGIGQLLLVAKNNGLNAFGIDLSFEALKVIKEIDPNLNTTKSLGEYLPFKSKSFDHVTCLGSLEHFLDTGLGLREMHRVTKDNGKIYIMVPNDMHILWKFTKQKGTSQQEISENLYSLEVWKNLIESNGLTIESVGTDDWFEKRITFKTTNPVALIKSVIKKVFWATLPLRWTYQFVFICSKNQN